ncbi:hypothetical protein REPUB_Repub07fG0006000 [Reevesia pubescens]
MVSMGLYIPSYNILSCSTNKMAPKKLLSLFQVLLILSVFLLGSAMASRNVKRTAEAYGRVGRKPLDSPWDHNPYRPPCC